jgi:ribonuclease E
MMTGTFEIVRTAQRSPEERPYRPSVSIEAGLATPTDLSEDIEEEEIEEEEVEEEEEREEVPVQSESREGQNEQRPRDENGEGGQRKRRRRGGRGRNRDRGDHPRTLQEAIPGAPVVQNEFASTDGEHSASEQTQQDGEISASSGSHEGTEGGEGGPRKRRRRRRGRRGRHDGEGQQNYANLEGAPANDVARGGDVIAPNETREPFVAKPNAESAPVWSFGNSSSAPKPEETPAASEASPKKGWWQRAFSSKD